MRLSRLLTLLVAPALLLAVPRAAHAQIAIRMGGGIAVHVGGSVGVHLGGGYGYGYGYGGYGGYASVTTFAPPPPPPPPPTSYDCACGYTPTTSYPSAGYASAGYVEPEVVAAPAPRPRTFGLGVFASSAEVGDAKDRAEGGGLTLRLRGGSVDLAVDLAGSTQDKRKDTRVAADLLVPLARGTFRPFLLVGVGVDDVHHPALSSDVREAYAEAGGGLEVRLGPGLSLGADVRWAARRVVGDKPVGYQFVVGSDGERALEGRANLIYYF